MYEKTFLISWKQYISDFFCMKKYSWFCAYNIWFYWFAIQIIFRSSNDCHIKSYLIWVKKRKFSAANPCFLKMLTFHSLQKSIIRISENLQSKVIIKTLLQYNYQLHQNNRIINPLITISTNTKHAINQRVLRALR